MSEAFKDLTYEHKDKDADTVAPRPPSPKRFKPSTLKEAIDMFMTAYENASKAAPKPALEAEPSFTTHSKQQEIMAAQKQADKPHQIVYSNIEDLKGLLKCAVMVVPAGQEAKVKPVGHMAKDQPKISFRMKASEGDMAILLSN